MKIRSCLQSIKDYVPGKTISSGIKLSSNENAFGPSAAALQSAQNAARTMHMYPDGSCNELKQKLATFYGLQPENIITGNGSDEILVMSALLLCGPNSNIVTSSTTFSEYTFAAQLMDSRIKTAELNLSGKFDLDAIASLVDSDTGIVFICNPNNPTGSFTTADELQAFVERIPSDVLVVLDEAYAEYADDPDYPDSIKLINRYENILVTRTFSKIYGLAGLRLGYGMAQPGLIRNLLKTKQPFNVNSIAQEAGAAAIDDRQHVEKSILNNIEMKKSMYRFLDTRKVSYYKTQANFICIDTQRNADTVAGELFERGISVRSLVSFGLNTCIRLTLGTPEQMGMFMDAYNLITGTS